MANEAAVTVLAAQQRGLITRAQLTRLGFTKAMVGHRCRTGQWTALGRSLIALGLAPTGLWGRATVASLAVPEGAISHRWAALLHDLPGLWSTESERRIMIGRRVDVSTGAGRGAPLPDHLVVHRRTRRPRSQHLGGVRVTTVPQTMLDLAAVLPEHAMDRVLDMSLAQGRCPLQALERHLTHTATNGVAGRAALARLLDPRRSTGGSASELERVFWELICQSGLELPERQVVMPWGDRVDNLWRPCRLIGELDSRSWHERQRDRERDYHRDAVAASCGYLTRRFTWHQVARDTATTLDLLAKTLEQRRSMQGL